MQSVSETGYLVTRLSVMAETCQLLSLFRILFFDSRSLRLQIVIA
jgi:hypothetical protein